MQFVYVPTILPLIAASIVALYVAGYAWLNRRISGASTLVFLALAVGDWTIGYALEIAGADLATKVFWAKVEYIGIAAIPLLWLIFSYNYFNQYRPMTSRVVATLSVIPLVTLVLVFTTELHGLVWSRYFIELAGEFSFLGVVHGFWFWVYWAYANLLLAGGMYFIIKSIRHRHGLYRGQIFALVVAVIAPWAGNISYVSGFNLLANLDPTPFGLTITIVLTAWAIFRYQLINLVPVARDAVIDAMEDGMLVLDVQGRIVDMNPAAARAIGVSVGYAVGKAARDVLGPWPHLVEQFRNLREARQDIVVGEGEAQRHYEISISPLHNRQNIFSGRIILFHELSNDEQKPRFIVGTSSMKHSVEDEIQPGYAVNKPVSPSAENETVMAASLVQAEAENRLWEAMRNFFFPQARMSVLPGSEGGPAWTQNLEPTLTAILRIAAAVGSMAALLTLISFVRHYVIVIVVVAAMSLFWTLALWRSLPVRARSIAFLLIVYALGVEELFDFGYSVEAFVCFLSIIVLAALLENWRGGLWSLSITLSTLSVFGWAIIQGIHSPPAVVEGRLYPIDLIEAGISLSVFTACALGLIIAINAFMDNLNTSWQKEAQALKLLQQERDLLDQRVRERARELAESEVKYRTLVEQLPVIVYQDEADEERRNIYLSPQIESVLGYSLAEFDQDPDLWDKIVYPEDYEPALAIAGEIIARGYSNSEYRLVKRDGSLVWFHDEALLVRDETNQIQFIQGIMQDITARKQAESALHQSETRYRALFEDSPISLWEEDLSEIKSWLDSLRGQGVKDVRAYLDTHPEAVYQCLDKIKVIDVNKATLQIYGVSDKTELLGKLPSILSGPGLAAFQTELIGIAEGKSHFEWTGRNLTLNGEEMEVQLSTSALPGYEADFSRVIISVLDITKLKKAEQELNRRNRQLESLHHVSLELLNRRKMDDLLQSIVDQAAVLMEAPYCEIMLEEKGELVVHAFTSNQPYLKGDRVGRDQSRLAWQAYDSGAPVIMADYADWSGRREIYDSEGLQSVADFPILISDRCLGVLGLARNRAGYPFDEQQIQIGKQYTQIIALVLDNLQLLDNSSIQAAALNAAANAIMMTDQQGTIQWVNSAFTDLTGYAFEEAIGKNPRILKSGRTSQDVYPGLWKKVLSGQAWHGELFNRRKDGTDFVEEMTITPLRNEDGNIYRLIAVMQDVTERKRAEEALRLSEEKYRNIFENVEDVFYETDYQGHIVTISPSIEKHSGYRPDEIIGKHVRSFFVNDQDYEKLDLAVSTQGVLNDYEMEMKRKNGSLIYVSATARVVFDRSGRPVGTDGVMRDITERKQNEIREQRRRVLLEKVLEMSKTVAQAGTFKKCLTMIHQAVQSGLGFDRVGVFLYDEGDRIVRGAIGTGRTGELEDTSWFNQALDEIQAWRAALSDPKGFFIDNDQEDPRFLDDNNMNGVKQNIICSAWAGNKPVAFLAADNLLSQRPFTDEQLEALQVFAGSAGLAIENARWKSELEDRVIERTIQLQESNANLSALAESSLALNKTLDLDEVLDHVLIQARRMVPCRTLSISLREGDRIWVARRLGDRDVDSANLRNSGTWRSFQRMIDDQASVLIPNTLINPDWQQASESSWVQSHIGIPIIIKNEAVGFLTANHDETDYFNERDMLMLEALASHASIAVQNARLIGDLKQSLEKEQNMRNQLVHADKLAALGKMVAVIAHEINNPIQTVKNAFFLIDDEIGPDNPAQEYLKIAKSEATRISDLVSQLRETYRARSKTFTRVELGTLLSEVRSILQPQLKKCDVIWHQPEPLASFYVFATKGNLKQVFINLALNAVEAMEQGGDITVAFALTDDRRDVGVRMHNTGPLIQEEDLPHIFEPFFTTKGSGSGLGLSISYDIIQQHGGSIKVESSPEDGVTFTVWLPLAPGDQGE